MGEKEKDAKTIKILKILVGVLAIVSLALLIALIVIAVTGKSSKTDEKGKDNGSPSALKDVEYCPENSKLGSTGSSPGIYDDLSKDEIIAIRDYVIGEKALNITPYDKAKISDNYIYLIELQQPSKADALGFLDKNAQKPDRMARVVIYGGGKDSPDVTEYLVGPAEKPTRHNETTGPGQKYPIPFNARFADPKELAIMDGLIRDVTKRASSMLKESYDGYTMSTDCKEKCLTWGFTGPSTFKVNQRKHWTWLMRDLIGYYIHPVGFEIMLDTGGSDVSKWRVEKIFYNNKTYDTVEKLLSAFNGGSKTFVPAPKENGKFSTYQRRGNPQPAKPLRNPQLFEPDGKRYTTKGRHVEYMGWNFCFRSRTTTGIQLFDVKFMGDRIVYELGVQDALAFYSGWAPKPMFTNFMDAAWGMGSMTFELLRGVDCPNTATFFDLIHLIGRNEPARFKNAVCLFEQDMGLPLRRHYDTNFKDGYNFYGGVPGSALILRTASTTYNYDYVLDYIFYPNGVLEVRTTTSGYAQTTFYTKDEDPYAYHIHPQMAGSLHDHIFNYKIDLDVLGTKNSHEVIQVGLTNFTNPWFPTDFQVQKILHRHLRKTEKEAIYQCNFKIPTYLNFFNPAKKNSFGVHRGYRIQIRDMMPQVLPESWPMVKGVAWSLNQMHVTKRKENEQTSSSIYNQQDMADPIVDFSKFLADDESIQNEDLVAWVTLGLMHIMHSEDVPNTATPGNSASFLLRPFSYFDEDPSMGSYDAVVIKPSGNGNNIQDFGTPTGPVCAPKNKSWEFSGRYGDS